MVQFTTLSERPDLRGEVVRIFFESSTVRNFASPEAKRAFQAKWLDPYIEDMPEQTIIALTPEGEAAGYLTGCFNSAGAGRVRKEVDFYDQFAPFYADYPAHLHITVDAKLRGGGIGAELIGEFARRCKAEGLPGLHLITGKAARNVSFYKRCGFEEVAVRPWKGAVLLMLGRKL
jgi:GNAT superfamily N-acetyltransferase